VLQALHLRPSRLLLVTALIVLVTPAAFAQTAVSAASTPQAADPAAKPPEFDVVSIRPNKDGAQMSGNGVVRMTSAAMSPPDGFKATNVSLKMLVATAYGIKPDQITGGADWVDSTHYDINAKVVAPDPADFHPLTSTQRNLMLRSLLADRFKLVVHNETKEAPTYELVVAKNGPKLQEAKPVQTTGADGKARGAMVTMRSGQFTGQAMQMAALVYTLSNQLGRPVVDKTHRKVRHRLALVSRPAPRQ